ncbi:MAG TPA: L-threonylcarbamoyladenylate synthase [Bacteroidales bacterium]|nr:L-threonylcarbamoyladenylate synthase [Bacteroidales bacterium]HPS63903.1 L-threonylcarbamoyladenylate synthase [Bacteroidales bacterium]
MEEEIKKCLDVLRKGGTILSPTDTIWGLGCDATSPEAVARIFRIKRRLEHKSLIVLLADASKLKTYVSVVPELVYDLLDSVDKPLTIIYPGARNLAPNLIAEDGTVAIRIVRDRFMHKLCKAFGKPISSTSANISGESAPLTYQSIAPTIIDSVDHAVPGEFDEIRDVKPSRIVRLKSNGEFEVIRP